MGFLFQAKELRSDFLCGRFPLFVEGLLLHRLRFASEAGGPLRAWKGRFLLFLFWFNKKHLEKHLKHPSNPSKPLVTWEKPWFSPMFRWFSLVFPCFPSVFPGFRLVFPGFPLFSIGFPRFSVGFPWFSPVFQRFSGGSPVFSVCRCVGPRKRGDLRAHLSAAQSACGLSYGR